MGTNAESIIRKRYHGSHTRVVDDEPINRGIALIQLAAAGLTVDAAEDGAVAVDMARRANLIPTHRSRPCCIH